MSDNFAGFVAQERERLNAERNQITAQRKQLEEKLSAIQREMEAITAYEDAKSGRKAPRMMRDGSTARRARNGSRREAMLEVLRGSDGMSRGDLLTKMGLKGDKAGEMSISNALTALTKSGAIRRNNGKYYAG